MPARYGHDLLGQKWTGVCGTKLLRSAEKGSPVNSIFPYHDRQVIELTGKHPASGPSLFFSLTTPLLTFPRVLSRTNSSSRVSTESRSIGMRFAAFSSTQSAGNKRFTDLLQPTCVRNAHISRGRLVWVIRRRCRKLPWLPSSFVSAPVSSNMTHNRSRSKHVLLIRILRSIWYWVIEQQYCYFVKGLRQYSP